MLSCFKTKTNSDFAVKVTESSNRSFSVYFIKDLWIILFKHLYSLIRDNGMYRTWLWKHTKYIRNSQTAISVTSVLNWAKHSFSLWVSLSCMSLSRAEKTSVQGNFCYYILGERGKCQKSLNFSAGTFWTSPSKVCKAKSYLHVHGWW